MEKSRTAKVRVCNRAHFEAAPRLGPAAPRARGAAGEERYLVLVVLPAAANQMRA